MSEAFDPYFKWLAIPKTEQPPNHYRLLGVPEFVSDLDVIEHASDQRMSHLRKFAVGEHSALSQKILNEVSLAKVVLLHAEKKAAYDAQLQQQRAARAANEPQPAMKTRAAEQAMPFAAPLTGVGHIPAPNIHAAPAPRAATKKPNSSLVLIGIGVVSLAMIGGAFALLRPASEAPPVAENRAIAQSDQQEAELEPSAERSAQAKLPEPTVPTPSEESPPPSVDQQPDESPQVTQSETPVADGTPAPLAELPEKEIAAEPAEPAVIEEISTAVDSVPQELPAAEVPQPIAKQPVPNADALRTAKREILEIYGDQFKSARDAAAKIKLAADLFDLGQTTPDDSAARYNMFAEAIRLAGEGGDVRLAIKAVDATAAEFEVDAWSMKIDTLQAAARGAIKKEEMAAMAGVTAEVASQAYDAHKYDEALKVARIAESLGKRAGDAGYTKRVRDRMAQIKASQAQHMQRLAEQARRQEAVEKARATLANQPDDAEANFIMGTHFSFEKDDWPGGLALLVKGDQEGIAQAAEKDLAATAPSSTDCLQLGDTWWDLAQGRSDLERAGFLFRAGSWYEKALPTIADGLQKKKIGSRLTTIYEEAGNAPSLAGSALHRVLSQGALLVMTFDAASLSQRGDQRFVNDLSGTGKQGTIEGATSRPGIAGDALSFDGVDDFVNLTDFQFNQGDYTVCVWVRGKGTVMGTGQRGEWPLYWMLNTDKVVHHIEPFRGGGREYDEATARDTLAIKDLPESEWKHLAVTRQGSVMRIYIDGKLAAEKTPYHIQPFVTHADWGLFLGMIKLWGETSRSVGGALPRVYRFTGLIDELAVFDRSLPDLEILSVYQFGSRGHSLLSAPLRRTPSTSAR